MKFLTDLEHDSINKSKTLKNLYEDLLGRQKFYGSKQRSIHLRNTIFTKPDGKAYLNRYHQNLCGEAKVSDDKSVLSVKDHSPERITGKYLNESKIIQLIFVIAMFYCIYNKFLKEANQEYTPSRLGM
ncbi:MAG: hypothetical protein ABI597_09990 [Gammaproteobacteria bacterium]